METALPIQAEGVESLLTAGSTHRVDCIDMGVVTAGEFIVVEPFFEGNCLVDAWLNVRFVSDGHNNGSGRCSNSTEFCSKFCLSEILYFVLLIGWPLCTCKNRWKCGFGWGDTRIRLYLSTQFVWYLSVAVANKTSWQNKVKLCQLWKWMCFKFCCFWSIPEFSFVQDWPEARGWVDATTTQDSFFIFGGMTGDDANSWRLDDFLWECMISKQIGTQ